MLMMMTMITGEVESDPRRSSTMRTHVIRIRFEWIRYYGASDTTREIVVAGKMFPQLLLPAQGLVIGLVLLNK